MDRKSVIGLVLIALVIIVFAYVNSPSQADVEKAQRYEDSLRDARAKKENLKREIKSGESLDDTTTTTLSAGVVKIDSTKQLTHADSLKLDSVRLAKERIANLKKYADFSSSASGEAKEY